MSSLISWVSRLRSALLIGRSCELISCARTARTRWSRSAWSRFASYSCGPSCFSSSVWTSCLSSSRRSYSALPRRLVTRDVVEVVCGAWTAAARWRLPASSPPFPRGGGVWEGSGPSGPLGGGGVGGAPPLSVWARAAARRSARLLTMSPLDPEELGETVVVRVRGTGRAVDDGTLRLAHEQGREVAEGSARGVVGAGRDDRRAGVRGGGDVDGRRDLRGDVHPQDRLDLLRADADGVVGPVQQQVEVAVADVEHLDGVEGDLDVLQGRDVERRDDDALVGLVQGGQRLLVEGRRGVDHDEVVHGPQGAQDLRDEQRTDPLTHVGVARRRQHLEGVLVAGEQRVEHRGVEVLLGADRVL